MAVVGEVSSIQLPNGNEYEILDKDAALAKTPTDISATEETFVYQKSSGGSCKYLTSIKGNSIVWNNLIRDFSSWGSSRGTVSVSGNVLTYTVTNATGGTAQYAGDMGHLNISGGHKYYISLCVKTDYNASIYLGGDAFYNVARDVQITGGVWNSFHYLVSMPQSQTGVNFYIALSARTGGSVAVGDKMYIKDVIYTDLTFAFGTGKEPSSVDTFEAWLAHSGCSLPTSYTPGILRNNSAIALETSNNIWDGKTSATNAYLQQDGHVATNVANHYISSKVLVTPGVTYRLVNDGGELGNLASLVFYTSSGGFISGHPYSHSTSFTIRAPQNASYCLFSIVPGFALDKYLFKVDDGVEDNNLWKQKLNLGLDAIKVKSPNIWDEEWEQGGIHPDTGAEYGSLTQIRSKNYIPASPNTAYYIKCNVPTVVVCFDASKNSLGWCHYAGSNTTFTTKAETAFVRFCTYNSPVPTYNNDICINLSGWANGRYFPHGILTFEDDMRSAGTAYNEKTRDKYYRRAGRVDLGELEWTYQSSYTRFITLDLVGAFKTPTADSTTPTNVLLGGQYDVVSMNQFSSGNPNRTYALGMGDGVVMRNTSYTDATTFQTSLSGVELNYELAVEEVYELANPTEMWVFADKDGTERIIYPESTTPYAPFRCDSFYATISAEAINDSLNLVEDSLEKSTADINERIDELDSENPWEHGSGTGSAKLKVISENSYSLSISGEANATYYELESSIGIPISAGMVIAYNGVTARVTSGGLNAFHVDRTLSSSALTNASAYLRSGAFGSRSILGGVSGLVGGNSIVAGDGCYAASNAFAHGQRVFAKGLNSSAEGYNNKAEGEGSHIEGGNGTASGKYSHVEGSGCQALENMDHAEGWQTIARGNSSHAEGSTTIAYTAASHAEGYHTSTPPNGLFGAHAEGIYNFYYMSDAISCIGIGSSENNRRNAMTVVHSGDVFIYGIGGYDGQNGYTQQSIQSVIGRLENIEELTQQEIDVMFEDSRTRLSYHYLYTEDFQNESFQDIDEWAQEWGYSNFSSLVEGLPQAIIDRGIGCQRFYPTGETIEYNDETLEVWKLQFNRGEEWLETTSNSVYGLLRSDVTDEDIENYSISVTEDVSDCFVPFETILDEDDIPYREADATYALLFFE